jgi:hypothetical protein
MRRPAYLLPLLLVAACTGQPRQSHQDLGFTVVPDRPSAGVSDPTHQAVFRTSYAFGDTSRIAGRPADAARAAADLEWLTVALPQDQRWIGASPFLFAQLEGARTELRATLGIPQDATPAAVTQRLYAAAEALDAGRRTDAAAALGGEAALARLDALPQLPRTSSATQMAQSELGHLMGYDPTGGSG